MSASVLSESRLTRVLSETLEEAAFIFIDQGDDGLEFTRDTLVRAGISYTKDNQKIELVIVSTEAVATELAANFMGIEPDDPMARQKSLDAFAEILNIVCGALLEDAYGDEAEYEMGVPHVGILSRRDLIEEDKNMAVRLQFETEEGERLDFGFRLL